MVFSGLAISVMYVTYRIKLGKLEKFAASTEEKERTD